MNHDDVTGHGAEDDTRDALEPLADLHSDLTDHDGSPAAESSAARRRTALGTGPTADPAAARVVEALDRTRADLAAAPAPALPPFLLADLDRALARERTAPPRVDPPPAGRPRRRLLLAAAAAVLVVAGVAGVLGLAARSPAGAPAPAAAPDAIPVPGPPPVDVVVLRDDALGGALGAGAGRSDYGVLSDPARRAACLAAQGLPSDVRPIGARRVVLDGVPGVLLVLPTGTAARFRLLVVGDTCRAGDPSTLADRVVGP